ncbi:MAG: septum formation initiator family protein [Endomicrobium sp.]|jgi:cell division protein FtsB|nr:septum formation initiator family protein [Endomicrobium sp.]
MKKFRIRSYAFFTVVLLILVFNKGSRALFRHFFDQRVLIRNIKSASYQNELLKKRIYCLENEPSYFERMIRSELNVIAQGEIEYRFNVTTKI